MMDGIYSITFRGTADWGIGVLVFRKGTISGADGAGVLYDGRYSENSESVTVNMKLTVPPGVTLVQGSKPQPKPYEVEFDTTILKSVIDSSHPHLVHTPPGPVNVIFRRLRDIMD